MVGEERGRGRQTNEAYSNARREEYARINNETTYNDLIIRFKPFFFIKFLLKATPIVTVRIGRMVFASILFESIMKNVVLLKGLRCIPLTKSITRSWLILLKR